MADDVKTPRYGEQSSQKHQDQPNLRGSVESMSSLPTVSLPKGGGAIRSIGEKFAANPVTGTGSMSVPIAVSPGRSGFGPQLALSYDSGSGNGPFGIGWALSLPSVTRKTDKGLPRYRDREESDVYILSGAEDLVPATNGESNHGAYAVRCYRPRTEGLFARIEQWTNDQSGETHWRSISKENITTLYGLTGNSRIADGERVFTWLICESRDDRGNAIVYRYQGEDEGNVDTSAANERNRIRTANRYLKRIRYGNRLSCLTHIGVAGALVGGFVDDPEDADYARWMFETVFDYGDHSDAEPTPTPDTIWPCRYDAFANYRSGFEVRSYRLCRRVLMFHHFSELAGHELVKSTDFAFSSDVIASMEEGTEKANAISEARTATYLTSVTQTGWSAGSTRSLPPLEFEYSAAIIDPTVREVDDKSLEGMPVGLGGGYQFADLDGEGSSGVLVEQGTGWFYKRNTSAGNLVTGSEDRVEAGFEAPAALSQRPNTTLSGGARLVDLAGDGSLDVVAMEGPGPGFYERDNETWTPLRNFESSPNLNFNDPNLRLVDLTGDGHADIMITGDEVFTWYPSMAERGFGPAEFASKPWDEEKGPKVVFADGTESIFLADMSGDGLTDLVRIRNGETCYWPNLGYGRFGAKVTMDNSPLLDTQDHFDPKRLRLADIDGSGTTDLLYLTGDGVRIHFNQSGNRWSEAHRLSAYPATDNLTSVDALDLLGIGTACLVWSSPLPGNSRRPMRYIDLMGGTKPHLLIKSVNNMGAETRVHYAPSTRFYLADRAAGKPWITRIPFVVHTVDRVETLDRVSGNRFVTRYAYHHGYFDGEEREFRGFGMVESWDTEEYDFDTEATNYDEASTVPPVLTKTWFHTGAFIRGAAISRQFEKEYFREDGWTDEDFENSLLPDTVLPQGLPVAEIPEACRALRGSVLRREVYALDGTVKAGLPYSVTEQNYTIRHLQPSEDNRHGVFFVHPRESIDYLYERNISDPRIKHALTLEVDDYGNVKKSVAIGYGRSEVHRELQDLENDEHFGLDSSFTESQTRTRIVVTDADFTNVVDGEDDHRTPLPCQTRTYELGVPDRFGTVYTFAEIYSAVIAENPTEIPFEQTAPADGEKRLIEHSRFRYRKNDLSGPLGLNVLESLALPDESFTKVLTPGMLNAEPDPPYEGRVTTAMLVDGGYVDVDTDGHWWVPSGRLFYSDDPEHTASQELAEARDHFFLPRRALDPFGNQSLINYDTHDLLIAQAEDAMGNITVVTNNYRVLVPSLIIDPNENRTAFAFDELGLVVKTAAMGKTGANEGDDLDHPTALFDYHLDTYINNQTPVYVKTETRETHYHPADPDPDDARRQTAYLYSDGFGREIQTKIQAEPGPVEGETGTVDPRWVGSGWTIYNNKGLPVRKCEPFFSITSDFELARTVGVSPIVFYDPLGRVVGTLYPDHSWEKVAFDTWKQETWDRIDTVLIDPTTDADVGDYFARLPDADYTPTWHAQNSQGTAAQQDAAEKTAALADTPARIYFDSLGRPFFARADNGDDKFHLTHTRLDIEGNALAVTVFRDTDTETPLAIAVMTTNYDVAGRPIRTISPDAGTRILLTDIAGKPLYTWDSRDHRFRIEYDALRRPVRAHLVEKAPEETWSETTATEKTLQETIFGDADHADAPADPVSINARTRPYIQRDGSGETTFPSYDFKGNALEITKTLAADFKNTLDWSDTVDLESESFATTTTYDALSRVVSRTTPDESVTFYSYNEAGLLESVDVKLRGAQTATPFVTNIDYNARGQRTTIEYANGTVTTYEYDPLTFRLVRQITDED